MWALGTGRISDVSGLSGCEATDPPGRGGWSSVLLCVRSSLPRFLWAPLSGGSFLGLGASGREETGKCSQITS